MKKFLLGFVAGILFCGLSVLVLGFAALSVGMGTLGKGSAPPSLSADTTLMLHLEGEFPEQAPLDVPPLPLFESRQPMTMLDTWKLLRKAAADSRIKSLVLEPRGLQAGWAKLEELRAGVQAFKKSGKPVYAYLRTAGTREYYLATAGDKIFMAPEDLLDVKGLRAELMYFKGTLDKLGVAMEFESVGKYKDAPDQFTRESARPETLEVVNQIVDQYYANLVSVIAEGRKLPPGAVRAVIDQGPFTGKNALDAGLVDGLIFEDQITPDFRTMKRISGREYNRATLAGFEGGARIAIVTGDGEITRGGTDEVFSDTGITASSFVRTLKQVGDDAGIQGVILRVDSPGGDAIASDDILHELKTLSSRKPLVISMSDTAASGGYFISMTGDPVLAYANTLTGSIGVYYGRINLKGLYDKIGLKKEILSRGRYSRIDSEYGPLSEEERGKLRREIQAFYKGFVERVASSRKRPYEQVEPLAQGRVWLGAQARQNGLIDEIGGLDRAVELVKQRARIGAGEKVTLVTFPPRRTLLELLLKREDESAALESRVRAILPRRVPVRALMDGGVLRLMPYVIDVK
jgi:protease-4